MTTETTAAATEPRASKILETPAKSKASRAKAKPTLKADALGTMRPAAKPAANGLPKSGDRSAAKPASKPARKAASKRSPSTVEGQPAKAPRAPTARQQAEASLLAGNVPLPPNFSKPTHARFRGKHAELVALVERGDIKRLRAWTINAVSSSPKALMKYRDRAIVALTARAKAAKA